MKTKTCAKCSLEKEVSTFPKNKAMICGYDSWCFPCRAAYAEERRQARPNTPESYLKESVWGLAKSSRQRHINSVYLIELYYSQKGLCALSKQPMTWQRGKGHVHTNISVDRIDSTKDYIEGNIQLVCYIVNTMKNTSTLDELKFWCKNILENN